MTTDDDAAKSPPTTSAPDTSTFLQLSAETLPPEPSTVSQVRRLCRQALTGAYADDVIDDVVLVASELLTNALIHSGSTVGFTLIAQNDELLIEVHDRSPHEPRPRAYGGQARTGRGLALVEALTTSWGYRFADKGKVVWGLVSSVPAAEVVTTSNTVPGTFPVPAAPPPGTSHVRVELHDVPQLLHAAWRQHAQALLREHLLASMGEDEDVSPVTVENVVKLHADATDAIALLDEHIPRMGVIVDIDHDFLSLQEPTVSLDCILVPVPVASISNFAVLERIIAETTEIAASGQLLTPPMSSEVVAFHTWVCRQVLSQASQLSPEPWVFPMQSSAHVSQSSPLLENELGQDDTPRIAISRSGLVLGANAAAEALLGYLAGELIGLPITRVIPARHRQAHVAGMTMYNLTDRRNLLGHGVDVSVVCLNGSEANVRMVLNEAELADGAVVIAELAPGHTAYVHGPPAAGVRA